MGYDFTTSIAFENRVRIVNQVDLFVCPGAHLSARLCVLQTPWAVRGSSCTSQTARLCPGAATGWPAQSLRSASEPSKMTHRLQGDSQKGFDLRTSRAAQSRPDLRQLWRHDVRVATTIVATIILAVLIGAGPTLAQWQDATQTGPGGKKIVMQRTPGKGTALKAGRDVGRSCTCVATTHSTIASSIVAMTIGRSSFCSPNLSAPSMPVPAIALMAAKPRSPRSCSTSAELRCS